MQIRLEIGHPPRSGQLAHEVSALRDFCIGCKSCTGLCPALAEALHLPDIVLKGKDA